MFALLFQNEDRYLDLHHVYRLTSQFSIPSSCRGWEETIWLFLLDASLVCLATGVIKDSPCHPAECSTLVYLCLIQGLAVLLLGRTNFIVLAIFASCHAVTLYMSSVQNPC
jgi:hypothetical protein